MRFAGLMAFVMAVVVVMMVVLMLMAFVGQAHIGDLISWKTDQLAVDDEQDVVSRHLNEKAVDRVAVAADSNVPAGQPGQQAIKVSRVNMAPVGAFPAARTAAANFGDIADERSVHVTETVVAGREHQVVIRRGDESAFKTSSPVQMNDDFAADIVARGVSGVVVLLNRLLKKILLKKRLLKPE
ncbi:hypothetical protein B1A99_15205 [Cohnella sp. CIP 111063]|nr:hypothetical protein B1A99_15205 [Cohnella sp. CIP 111063]